MNTCKKIIVYLFVLIVCLYAFAACGGDLGEDGAGLQQGGTTANPIYPDDAASSTGGTHLVSVTRTDMPITTASASDYKIIMPAQAEDTGHYAYSDYLFAPTDLQQLIFEATGARLEIVSGNGLSYSAEKKYLSVGDNAYTAGADVAYPWDILGDNGCRILTKGNSVFMGGANVYGTMNAVYEFLKQVAGYRQYDAREPVFSGDAAEHIMFYTMDVTEVPDFQYRQKGAGSIVSMTYLRRTRTNFPSDIFINVGGDAFHNEFGYIPTTWRTAHPKWFAVGTNHHLCLLAQGDPIEKAALDDEFFRVMKAAVIANPVASNITITQADERSWCRCAVCTAEYEKYGTDAGMMIKFVNQMNRKLKTWIASADNTYFPRDRQINVIFFAYQNTVNAPVVKNADGAYSAIDQEVIPDDNVYPFYAPIETYYTRPFDDPDTLTNVKNYENLKAWSTISKHVWLWPYATNYRHYLYPYNSFGIMQDNYKLFKTLSRAELIFDLHQHNQFAATGFHEYKWWLAMQLMWNTDLDVAALTDEYFDGYFKTAAAPMRTFYEELRTHMTYLENHLGMSGNLYVNVEEQAYWPKTLLDRWMGYVSESLAAAERLKATDPAAAEIIRRRVTLESVFPRFALIQLYPGKYSDRALLDMKTSFKADVQMLGINRVSEWVLIDTVFATWGI
ncbi:MAG: DUF4838 domain-containing protein [Clostridiales bacterium]|jgi:hypothetical protein|nr:DUF4838 domain-containing protein [Clostridiales bacterium]